MTLDTANAREALNLLERLAAERPSDHFQPMSDAVRKLIALRDELITRHRAGGATFADPRLQQLNAVISVAIGAQFPMVGIKWDRVEQTRDALQGWLRRHAESGA